MTDEMRKMLTEFLGECWHEWGWVSGGGLVCKHCSIDLYGNNNLFHNKVMGKPDHRTFTTDADMMAVFRKIRDAKRWGAFREYAFLKWFDKPDSVFSVWLFLDNPERACCLAAMWLEEQR